MQTLFTLICDHRINFPDEENSGFKHKTKLIFIKFLVIKILMKTFDGIKI